jgi:putative chitinase
MSGITSEQLQQLAPNAHTAYKQAFQAAAAVFEGYGITTGLRLAHFMAQALHETGGRTILEESMNYRAERIVQVWPSRFKTVADAQPFAHNPEALANNVYADRMGNNQPGDGWRFIGRGLLQITGRESYTLYGARLGIDLIASPELAMSAQWALPIALEEWKASNCNALADADNLRGVTRAINGGYIGLSSRADWLAKTKHIWGT